MTALPASGRQIAEIEENTRWRLLRKVKPFPVMVTGAANTTQVTPPSTGSVFTVEDLTPPPIMVRSPSIETTTWAGSDTRGVTEAPTSPEPIVEYWCRHCDRERSPSGCHLWSCNKFSTPPVSCCLYPAPLSPPGASP